MELIAGAAFEQAVCASCSGPEILIYKRFREQWKFLDRRSFQPASTDSLVKTVASSRDDIFKFAEEQLNQPRDDYKAILELSIIFLGAVPV